MIPAVLALLASATADAASTAAVKALAQRPTRPSGGWVNVRDYGASGSGFETTGKIQAGSKQIAVTDVGDFKVGQGVVVYKANIRFVDA